MSDSAAHQVSLCFTIFWNLLKFVFIESVMSSNRFILCCPLLLLPSIFLSIRIFPMSQLFASGGQSIGTSVSASVLPMNSQGWFPLGLIGLISLQSKELSRVFSKFYFAMHIWAKVLHKLLIFVIKLVRPHRELMVWDFLGNCFTFWSGLTLFL